MWKTKYFDTYEAMRRFVDKNLGRIQWVEIFVNNGYGLEYRKLRRVY